MITTRRKSGIGTDSIARLRQSRSMAHPASERADAIWSMIPQGTPTKSFSARCASRAAVKGSHGCRREVENGARDGELECRRGRQAGADRYVAPDDEVHSMELEAVLAVRPDHARGVVDPGARRNERIEGERTLFPLARASNPGARPRRSARRPRSRIDRSPPGERTRRCSRYALR